MRLIITADHIDQVPVISDAQGSIETGTKNAEYNIIWNALFWFLSPLGSNLNPAFL